MATTNQYSDIFTYETLAFDGANVSYANVTLIKDICAKKAGAKLDEIRLDTRTGKFTVPRPKAPALSTRSKTEMETAAKTLVEFQGKHTRFPEEDSGVPEDDEQDIGNEGFVMPKTENRMVTLKIYENKRKLFKFDSDNKKDVIKSVLKATNGEIATGVPLDEPTSRGALLVTLLASSDIPMNTLTEFGDTKMYYMRVV
jgi:hypothetical protein